MIAIAMLEATAAATPLERCDLKTVDAAAFPARLEIDYVRVWASEHSVAGR
jgi:hypothetical protein